MTRGNPVKNAVYNTFPGITIAYLPFKADIVRNARNNLNVRMPDMLATLGKRVMQLKQTVRMISLQQLKLSRTNNHTHCMCLSRLSVSLSIHENHSFTILQSKYFHKSNEKPRLHEQFLCGNFLCATFYLLVQMNKIEQFLHDNYIC